MTGSNHGDHGAARGKAITIVIPVFPVPPIGIYTTLPTYEVGRPQVGRMKLVL